MIKIALIYPEVLDLARFKEKRKEFPPFGVLYLAAVAEEAGYEVKVFDVNSKTISLDLQGYDVVGFSIPSSVTYGIIKTVRQKSKYKDKALVLLGGVHPNFYPLETLLDIKPDILSVGEGEEVFLEILKSLPTDDFSSIRGIYYLRDGKPRFTGNRIVDKNIDWLPLPARHLLRQDLFIMNNRLSNTDLKMAHVMFSRGCPFKCTFCAAAQTIIQYRSGWHARQELVHLIEQYNIEGFAITDDNFIVSRKKVIDIVDQIKDLNLSWSALSRVDTLDESLMHKIFNAGCIEIKFGVESGSEKILKAMRKNTTLEQIIHTLTTAKKVGINVKAFVIHGYPGESMETTLETISLLEKLKGTINRVSLFRFVPLPGTYVYDNPEKFALKGTIRDPNWDDDWSKFHIHHNNYHWWGSDSDFEGVEKSYRLLQQFIDSEWPDTFKFGGL